jgi:hypothetical protein
MATSNGPANNQSNRLCGSADSIPGCARRMIAANNQGNRLCGSAA